MRKTVFKAICINEYVKNIRLHSFAPTFAIFSRIFSSKILEYFPQKFLGENKRVNKCACR